MASGWYGDGSLHRGIGGGRTLTCRPAPFAIAGLNIPENAVKGNHLYQLGLYSPRPP